MIHFKIKNVFLPCIYSFLSDKKETTYRSVFTALKGFNQQLNPPIIHTDFERAIINSIQSEFINSKVVGFFSTTTSHNEKNK